MNDKILKRVVVTGLGTVSPLGVGTEYNWKSLLSGKSGITNLSDAIVSDLPVKVGGVVPSSSELETFGFDPLKYLDAKDQRKVDRFILFAIAAASEASRQSQWYPNESQGERTGTIIATGIGGFPAIVRAVQTTYASGSRKLSPYTVPSFLANLAAGHVSIKYGYKGPIGAPVTACAAGVQAIGDAARLIAMDEIDAAVCGGAEACIDRVSLGGFAAARALSTKYNDRPELASRPFDKDRDGFVMGEGAGLIMLESLDNALQRKAKILAEVIGYGTTADAYHLTSGSPDGNGAKRAMQLAIDRANITPDHIQHINAHATGTLAGDASELEAIKSVFGSRKDLVVSGTKGATGHLMGAAGGIEAIFAILSLRDNIAPPTLNLKHPDDKIENLIIKNNFTKINNMQYVMSNGFGFGGVNASVIFKKFQN